MLFGAGRWLLVLAACGAGLLVFGLRLTIAEGQVSWLPYLDQWEAEIGGLVAPLAHGTLGVGDLVASNNEHRIVLTRAGSLAAVELNGGWDNRVTVVGMFILQSATVAWICAFVGMSLGWTRGALVCAVVALPMFLVCDWENIVSGFQDQFGFMVLGSVVAFSMLDGGRLKSVPGSGALVMAVLLVGSMASGLLTAPVMLLTSATVALVERRQLRRTAGFGAACAAITALGWLARSHFPHLPAMYAQSLHAWLDAFLAYAAWPLPPTVLGLLCLWLPWGLLLEHTLRHRRVPPFASFVLALGLWVLLQACGLAWSRAGLSGLVSARYTEVLSWGFVANSGALVLLFSSMKVARPLRMALGAGMAIWVGVIGSCEVGRSQAVYRPYFRNFRLQTLEQERRVGTFMRTDDARVIESVSFPHIPYTAAQIIPLLRDPRVRPLLPGPLRRDFARDRTPLQVPAIHDGPLSFAATHALRNGRWFITLGLAALGAAFFLARGTAEATRSGAGS